MIKERKSRKDESTAESGSEFVDFGDVCIDQIGMQAQYAFRYATGFGDYPNLGEGLRFQFREGWDRNDYSAIAGIHKDDVEEFVRRVKEHKKLP